MEANVTQRFSASWGNSPPSPRRGECKYFTTRWEAVSKKMGPMLGSQSPRDRDWLSLSRGFPTWLRWPLV